MPVFLDIVQERLWFRDKSDFEQAADTGLTLIDLGMSDSSFFRNAKDGDFTIINTGSTVYTQEYGDPRWITVSEY